jgi:hypothetical protein
MAYSPLTRHVVHIKRHVQQFFYCYMRIRCQGNVFTEPLANNDKGIDIQAHRLMGEIYEVRRRDGFRCLNVHNKFHKYWFKYSKVDTGNTQTYSQHGDLISLLLFLKIRKVD